MPLPSKISEYATDMKHFQKACYARFRVQTSLHLVNIQPNSKLHAPNQNVLDPLL